MMSDLIEFLYICNIPYEENIAIASKCWIKFGGTASFWITPTSATQLEEICRYLYSDSVEFDFVGQTFNIFFPLLIIRKRL